MKNVLLSLLIAGSLLFQVWGCDDAGPSRLDSGFDGSPLNDLHAGEGPVTKPVVDMFVPLDQGADLVIDLPEAPDQ